LQPGALVGGHGQSVGLLLDVSLLGTDERPLVALLGLSHSPPIQVIETFDAKETGSTAQAFIFVCAHEGPFI
jgi:hypothetical protein